MPNHIILLNWKDTGHPGAGGAEYLTEDIARYLTRQGHRVTIVCSRYAGAAHTEVQDGITYIRRGSHVTVRLWVPWLWFTTLRHTQPTVVIDQIHWIPFFTNTYIRTTPIVPFIHEVASELWNQTPFLVIGKILERWSIKTYKQRQWITVSPSTKNELTQLGIPPSNISIIPETIRTPAIQEVRPKQGVPTLLWLGRITPHKQLSHTLHAYIIAKEYIPDLRLVIAGPASRRSTATIAAFCDKYPNARYMGAVSEQEKHALLTDAWALVSSSKKEGYGLTVLEAARRATPTIAYRVAGLRDAVIDTKTGLLSDPTPEDLARTIINYLKDSDMITTMQTTALQHSLTFSEQKTGQAVEHILGL